MKKTLRLLLSAVTLVALLAGMQMTAFAAVASAPDETSIPDEVSAALPGTPRADTDAASMLDETSVAANDTDRLNAINPISANPDTGAESLAIPAVVALLAASTAAIALSAKKKEK